MGGTAGWALALAAGLSIAAGAPAQEYPTRSVRVVIPITAGSGLDIIGRWVSQKLSDNWGQPVVVDNRPGAGGVIGTGMVAKSTADGYTLLVAGSAHSTNPALYTSLPYDTLKDFVVIAPLASLIQVVVAAPSAGYKTVPQLIAAAKAKPGQTTFASPGTGSGVHFTGEKFRLAAGIDVVHVPYKGGPEAMNDVMAGRVTYWIPSLGTALPFIQSGKLLALAVTSRQRSAVVPDVPTVAEGGIPFDESLWFGLWAPARTPGGVVDKLAKDAARALAAPDLRERFRTLVAEPINMTPAEFSRFVSSETESAIRIARTAGIKAQ